MSKKLGRVIIGVMSLSAYKERTGAIATGKYKAKANEPRIWFNSIKSLANVLSEENQALLRLILDEKPESIAQLERLSGRKQNNILRTLRTMEQYGLVTLKKGAPGKRGKCPIIPEVNYDFSSEIDINILPQSKAS
jgi:predicted transcriptional regulator